MRRAALLAPPLALAACVATPTAGTPPPAAAPEPRFDALAFFTGRLVGEERLAKAFAVTEPVRVENRGTVSGGTLVLDQTVHEGGKPARRRRWAMREVAPRRYRGTLSDAAGPVTGESIGNRLHLAFAMAGGLRADERLTLSPDGRWADNVLTVRKLGMTLAALRETIRRMP